MKKYIACALGGIFCGCIGAAVVGIPQQTEIDLLRAAALQSAAREVEHDRQLAAALAVGTQLHATEWQMAPATSPAKSSFRPEPEAAQPPKEAVKPQKAPVPREGSEATEAGSPPADEADKPAAGGGIDAQAMLAAHNGERDQHGLPRLIWSDRLSAQAEDWAKYLAVRNKCIMQHSGTSHGENIYYAGPKVWSNGRRELNIVQATRPVEMWLAEEQWYHPASGQCSAPEGESCGHYTQIVWRDTKEVGCGMAVCPNKAQIWVCRYNPAGNITGKRPF